MRRAAKIDATQDAIVKALRAIGIAVEIIGKPVDLLACTQSGVVHLLEVKNRDGKNQITREQAEFMARWPGTVSIVYNPEDAIRAVLGEAVLR